MYRAAALGQKLGSDAATVLLNEGRIAEDDFYRALARHLGTDFLDGPIWLDANLRYPQVLTAGAAPLAPDHAKRIVAAPRGTAIARLIEAASRLEHLPAITTPTRLREAVFGQVGQKIAADASDGLARHRPEWSCRPGPQTLDLTLAGLVLALIVLLTRLPTLTSLVLLVLIQAGMLALLTVRLASVGIAGGASEPTSDLLPDEALPTYTVLVALYREAAVVPRLVRALGRVDYPAAKLDIKFLLEADDTETLAAFRAAPLPARFEVVVVPDGQPRTKPRALNAALPLARGDHLVVYDAEDVIEPDQLRRAATLFARAPASTACLQGHLVIDNPGDGLLPRLFAIEYAALFEVLGPALAAWRVPTPLGGTSTHFRTCVLRELHGWDAWNVTEDADLGMRLAIAGYHVGDLPSATYEEAPKHLKAWLRQRTRWMKGFLQTSFTHGRDPLATWRRLGPVESLCALALLPGTVASALFYPFMMGPGLAELILGAPGPEAGLLAHATYAGAWTIFLGGLAAILIPGFVGCHRRGWRDLMWFVPLLPLYFGLVSAAAWLAVIELARHPHRWNKTEHGLSRTSRSGALGRGVTAACSIPRPSPSAAG
ncbi:glycosyl transferase [Methylobacterium sp. Leaf456]|nr:glycosyl transferase [Methylobacterium sp. Leaf456]